MDFILCTTENHWRLLSRSMTWSKLHFQRSLAAMRGRRLLVCSREEIRWPGFHCGRDPNSPGRTETYRNETRICTRIPSIHCYPCSRHWTEHQRKSEHDVEESTPYLLEPKALKFLVPLPNSNTILADFILNSFSLVQFSHLVVSDSLQSHGLQHARLPCPSWTPRAYSNSCPSSQWCHPSISSSVSPSSLAFNLPSIRVFSNKVSSSNQVAKVLEFQLQHQSFQWIFSIDFL